MKKVLFLSLIVASLAVAGVISAQPTVTLPGASMQHARDGFSKWVLCVRSLKLYGDKDFLPLAKALFDDDPFCCDLQGDAQTQCLEDHLSSVRRYRDYCNHLYCETRPYCVPVNIQCRNFQDYLNYTTQQKKANCLQTELTNLYDCHHKLINRCD